MCLAFWFEGNEFLDRCSSSIIPQCRGQQVTQSKWDSYKLKAKMSGFSAFHYLWARVRSQCFLARAVSKYLLHTFSLPHDFSSVHRFSFSVFYLLIYLPPCECKLHEDWNSISFVHYYSLKVPVSGLGTETQFYPIFSSPRSTPIFQGHNLGQSRFEVFF